MERMTSMKNWFMFSLLLFCTIWLLPNSARAGLQPGDSLPELSGETIDGTIFKLSEFKGEPIILKIGTTWCPSCRMQTKAISELDGFIKENKIRFVDVFVQESNNTVKNYFTKGGYALPAVIITDATEFHRKLNVYVIPRVILIDKSFKV